MVGRDLAIARYEGAPVHVCHVSAAESVAEIRRARELGVEVTAEVTPHHLCLTDEHVRSLDASRAKMSPPLRAATDRAALIEALADGTLDCIGTDHAPHRDHEKEQPFAQAPNGVIGLETAFPAVYTHLVEPGLVPLAAIVERMSVGPAAAFGLPRPAVREGETANLSLWNLSESWLVQPPYASRSANCAFAGQTLRARCHLTVAAGTLAHRLIEAVH
jgi:dihydroorotase